MTITLVIILVVVAFYAGGLLGYLLACLMFMAGKADDRQGMR